MYKHNMHGETWHFVLQNHGILSSGILMYPAPQIIFSCWQVFFVLYDIHLLGPLLIIYFLLLILVISTALKNDFYLLVTLRTQIQWKGGIQIL